MNQWKDVWVEPGPGSNHNRLFECFDSWQSFWKAGNPQEFKVNPRTALYLWNKADFPSLILKTYRARLPFPPWWPFLHGRLKRSWKAGCLLQRGGFPVPDHLLLVRSGFGQSVIISRKIDGIRLLEFVQEGGASSRVFRILGGLAARMHNLKITHGDFKWVNVILTKESNSDLQPWLIDFDGARIHDHFMWQKDFNEFRARDIARFVVAGLELGADLRFLKAFMQEYDSNVTDLSDLKKRIVSRVVDLLKRKGLTEHEFSMSDIGL